MKPQVQDRFKAELEQAQAAISTQDFDTAWIALQRAHILGQRNAIAHTVAHWHMLNLAWKQRDFQEVKGQILPTLFAFPLTLLFGQVRKSRGGKANLDPSQRDSIPDDLQEIFNQQ